MRLICLCCTHAAFAWFYCLSSFEFKVSKFKFKRMCLNPLCQKNLSLFSPPPLSAQTGPVSFLLAQPGASPSLPSFLSFLPHAAHSRLPSSRPKPPPPLSLPSPALTAWWRPPVGPAPELEPGSDSSRVWPAHEPPCSPLARTPR